MKKLLLIVVAFYVIAIIVISEGIGETFKVYENVKNGYYDVYVDENGRSHLSDDDILGLALGLK